MLIASIGFAAHAQVPTYQDDIPSGDDLEVTAEPKAQPAGSSTPASAASPKPDAAQSTPIGSSNAASTFPPSNDPTSKELKQPVGAGLFDAPSLPSTGVQPAAQVPPLPTGASGTPETRGLEWSGYLQFDYQHSQASSDQLQQGNGPLNQNRFLLRRGRIRVDRYWSWVLATLELDANTISGMAVGIRRAEGSVFYRGSNRKDLPPLVMLTAGITDLPFGYELLEPDGSRVFMERSLSSTALYPTKMDTGIKVSGAIAFVRYGIALTNGEPVDGRGFPRDPNNAKDITGRVGVDVPIRQILTVTGGISFAKGTGFHAGTPATKSSIVWRDENQDGIATSDELVGVPGTAAQPSSNFNRWALGMDLGFEIPTPIGATHVYGEIYAASNYDRGFLVADPVSAGVDIRELGGYAAVTQQVGPFGILGVRFSTYDPNADIFEERQGKLEPRTQTVKTVSLVGGVVLPRHARLLFEYDFVRDYLGRDSVGVPTDARNDTWTTRLQVNL